MNVIHFESLPSTNQYCELLDLSQVEEFTVITASQQTAGIGQRGNHWHSQPYQNLTFSLILKPTFLAAADQYQLTKALALGIYDWLLPQLPCPNSLAIKWPNDIYLLNRKICGTLITCHLTGTHIASAIAGIGLNINQTQFPDWVPNPTSLKLATGHEYSPQQLLPSLVSSIICRYQQLRADQSSPNADYLAHLFRLGTPCSFLYQGEELTATIQGVNRYGHLMLTRDDGREIVCQLKEIKMLV